MKNPGPRHYDEQWNRYWSSIQNTGVGGQVLWDTTPDHAAQEDFAEFSKYLDTTLPILDLGCGNGRQSRFLASQFKQVIGVDVSPAAIGLAKKETVNEKNITYLVANLTHPDEAKSLNANYGPMNIYMRGVLHVIQKADRPNFMTSLKILLADQGTLYQTELTGAALGYFRTLPGDSPSGVPKLLHRVIEFGIQPIGFSPQDRMAYFPDSEWDVLAEGASIITTVPLSQGDVGQVPASYLVARPKKSG